MNPIDKILSAQSPEELFGKLTGNQIDSLKIKYRKLAAQTHPDKHPGNELASKAFIRLSELRDEAEQRIEAKIYGSTTKIEPDQYSVRIKDKKYTICEKLFSGGIADFHRCIFGTKDYIIKIAKNSSLNDFLQTEISILNELAIAAKYDDNNFQYFCRAMEGLTLAGNINKDAVVVRWDKDYFSLDQILKLNKNGVGLRNTMWIAARILETLNFIHTAGICHGAIVPTHVLIRPNTFHGKLIDWSSSIDIVRGYVNSRRSINGDYREYYPPERYTSKSSDLFQLGKIMMALIGGDPKNNLVPSDIPYYLVDFLHYLTLNSIEHRPQSVGSIKSEFDWIQGKIRDKYDLIKIRLPKGWK